MLGITLVAKLNKEELVDPKVQIKLIPNDIEKLKVSIAKHELGIEKHRLNIDAENKGLATADELIKQVQTGDGSVPYTVEGLEQSKLKHLENIRSIETVMENERKNIASERSMIQTLEERLRELVQNEKSVVNVRPY